MRDLLTAALTAAALLAPATAPAQKASTAETQAVSAIVECLREGLPGDWQRVEMVVELPKPLAETGDVQYLVARSQAVDKLEPFMPCDVRKPPRLLLDARKSQPAKRRGWTAARLVLQRDGTFGVKYDFPK